MRPIGTTGRLNAMMIYRMAGTSSPPGVMRLISSGAKLGSAESNAASLGIHAVASNQSNPVSTREVVVRRKDGPPRGRAGKGGEAEGTSGPEGDRHTRAGGAITAGAARTGPPTRSRGSRVRTPLPPRCLRRSFGPGAKLGDSGLRCRDFPRWGFLLVASECDVEERILSSDGAARAQPGASLARRRRSHIVANTSWLSATCYRRRGTVASPLT